MLPAVQFINQQHFLLECASAAEFPGRRGNLPPLTAKIRRASAGWWW
ncbi:MAG TPA: hypothetical protein VG675_02130 [Bryobacteraceae bacterium]|nr:hypothetical protein [Bryobacteraceae bacterium]